MNSRLRRWNAEAILANLNLKYMLSSLEPSNLLDLMEHERKMLTQYQMLGDTRRAEFAAESFSDLQHDLTRLYDALADTQADGAPATCPTCNNRRVVPDTESLDFDTRSLVWKTFVPCPTCTPDYVEEGANLPL